MGVSHTALLPPSPSPLLPSSREPNSPSLSQLRRGLSSSDVLQCFAIERHVYLLFPRSLLLRCWWPLMLSHGPIAAELERSHGMLLLLEEVPQKGQKKKKQFACVVREHDEMKEKIDKKKQTIPDVAPRNDVHSTVKMTTVRMLREGPKGCVFIMNTGKATLPSAAVLCCLLFRLPPKRNAEFFQAEKLLHCVIFEKVVQTQQPATQPLWAVYIWTSSNPSTATIL